MVNGLSTILRDIVGDDHIHLWFDPNNISRNEESIRQNGTSPIAPKQNIISLEPEQEKELKERFEQTEFLRNWGFSQYKILEDGIGYASRSKDYSKEIWWNFLCCHFKDM